MRLDVGGPWISNPNPKITHIYDDVCDVYTEVRCALLYLIPTTTNSAPPIVSRISAAFASICMFRLLGAMFTRPLQQSHPYIDPATVPSTPVGIDTRLRNSPARIVKELNMR